MIISFFIFPKPLSFNYLGGALVFFLGVALSTLDKNPKAKARILGCLCACAAADTSAAGTEGSPSGAASFGAQHGGAGMVVDNGGGRDWFLTRFIRWYNGLAHEAVYRRMQPV